MILSEIDFPVELWLRVNMAARVSNPEARKYVLRQISKQNQILTT
jgi:hypothetical protein